ncbi:MAG: hypothetical protein K2Q07_07965 [Burkholderiaceae bacterium]|nr:hypothetical protein [Burkholderiaceae bacterium]
MPRTELEDHPDAPAACAPASGSTCEEYELPSMEAVLAGTLALMTGYSQALQAAQHPQQRVLMGSKIGRNIGLLAEHPQLSAAFRCVMQGLQQHWVLMTACTVESEPRIH